MVSSARFWWGILLIGLGVLFLLDTVNLLDVGGLIVTFWPLILVFIGIRLLIRHQMGRGRAATGGASRSTFSEAQQSTGDSIDESVLFGNANARVVSTTFRGGKVSCIFGGADVDLIGAHDGTGNAHAEDRLCLRCCGRAYPRRYGGDGAANGVLGEVTVNGAKKEGFFPALEWTSPSYASGDARLQIDVSTVFGEISVVSVV